MILSKDIGFKNMVIEEVKVDMRATYLYTVADADVKANAEISVDNNPAQLSDMYAKNSRFRNRIALGLYPSGFFSALFGARLPGPGCVYVS
jgi:3-hydroxybutyryl-CoA dehydratase